MTALRPATIDEYLTWLRAWLDAGHQPTHAYDYPWSRQAWLTATRDFTLGGECGADAVHIIVPDGVRHTGGELGHNELYLMGGPAQRGGVVPVFSDPEFQTLPGVPEFKREEERKQAEWHRQIKARRGHREQLARDSDVTAWRRERPASSEEKNA